MTKKKKKQETTHFTNNENEQKQKQKQKNNYKKKINIVICLRFTICIKENPTHDKNKMVMTEVDKNEMEIRFGKNFVTYLVI